MARRIEPHVIQRGHVDHGSGRVVVNEVLVAVAPRGDLDVAAVRGDRGGQTAGHLLRMRRNVHRLQVGREPAAVESLTIAEDDGAALSHGKLLFRRRVEMATLPYPETTTDPSTTSKGNGGSGNSLPRIRAMVKASVNPQTSSGSKSSKIRIAIRCVRVTRDSGMWGGAPHDSSVAGTAPCKPRLTPGSAVLMVSFWYHGGDCGEPAAA